MQTSLLSVCVHILLNAGVSLDIRGISKLGCFVIHLTLLVGVLPASV